MQVVTAEFVSQKKVLLRYDIDVPIENGRVVDDFRLKAGLSTLKLCLENAPEVIMMGHIGRPASTNASLGGSSGQDSKYSVAPIYKWFLNNGFKDDLESGKLKLLENLRFEEGEDEASLQYAKELAELGDSPSGEAGIYINEAFAAFHKAASTTVLPTLLPSAAGLNFAKEVETLTQVKEHPQKPLIVIMGGAKVQDKLSVIQVMAKIADKVLVGGKLVKEIKDLNMNIPDNARLGELTEDGLDISESSIKGWEEDIKRAKMIVWNGPMGKVEEEEVQGTRLLAQMILESEAEVTLGGGDTVGFIKEIGLLEEFEQKGFVSSGGGAMLKLLSEGTIPTIKALEKEQALSFRN